MKKYKIIFINESRTTVKYRIARDVKRCVSEILKSSQSNNIDDFYKKLSTITKNAKSPKLQFSSTVKINEDFYTIKVFTENGRLNDIHASVSKHTKTIKLTIVFGKQLVSNEIFSYKLKRTLTHEITHIYDDFVNIINHYSDLEDLSQPLSTLYYFTSKEEISAYISEAFYSVRKHNKFSFNFGSYVHCPEKFSNAANDFIKNYWWHSIKNDKMLSDRFNFFITSIPEPKCSFDEINNIRQMIYTISKNKYTIDNELFNDTNFCNAISKGSFEQFITTIRKFISKS